MREREQKMVKNAITVLAQAMEHADPYLAGHSRRVADATAAMAEELALPDEMKRAVEIAAQLSQVGKMSIPAEIRSKEGRLTEDELAEMRRHVEYAEAALSDIDMPDAVVRAVAQMNERGDGSGYPHGLKLEEIDIPGRILAVADVFVARTSPRSYRPQISAEEALRVLEQHPAKYDARIVRALRHYVERARRETSSGQENRDARRSVK
jgi:HD-GYP domain-containing protein (c-di-GMP phosphodiesterase class II)